MNGEKGVDFLSVGVMLYMHSNIRIPVVFRYLILHPQQESSPMIFLKMFLQMKMMIHSAGDGERKKLSDLWRKTIWKK